MVSTYQKKEIDFPASLITTAKQQSVTIHLIYFLKRSFQVLICLKTHKLKHMMLTRVTSYYGFLMV